MVKPYRLYMNTGSPFARKARILIREKGMLADTSEIIISPMASAVELTSVNPISQIPTLQLPDGSALTDSTLMAHWLEAHIPHGPVLYPKGELYWRVLKHEVLAVGMLEMLVKMVLETRRPEGERSASWLKRWQENLFRALSHAEEILANPDEGGFGSGAYDGAQMTLGIALTYINFRFPDLEWKNQFPLLCDFCDDIEKRQTFIDTYPN